MRIVAGGEGSNPIAPAERARLLALLERGGFSQLGAASPDGVYAYALDGNFIAANDVFHRRAEFTAEEMATRPFGSGTLDEFKQLTADNFAAVAAGQPRSWRTTVYTKSGGQVSVLTTAFPFHSDGVCEAVIGIVRDVELLEQTQAQARQLEDRLEQTLESMPDSIMFVDRDWTISFMNPQAEAMTASAPGERVGVNFWEAFPTVESGPNSAAYRRAMVSGERAQFRVLNQLVSRWVEITVYPTADGIALFGRDVSEEEEARALLNKTEKRTITQAALLDAARDAMVVRNLDGSIAYWNRAATELYGWTAQEAMGELARELLYDDPIQYDKAVIEVLTAGYWFGTLNQRTKDGRKIIVEGRWTLVHAADGQPDSIFVVNTDVTVQLQEEQELLRTQRMESLGRLAGGIAHDLNNVLTPILMSAQLLSESQQHESDRALALGIERAAMRGADLIRQVLSFARGDEASYERVNVKELLTDLTSFCTETLPKSIAVTVGVSKTLPDVRGDATQLMQVLINLVVNARDAMPEGGSLRIAAFTSPATVANETMLVIEVEDNGIGMDAATLETMFDPFFTTKLLGSGTGLGLATSLSIARRHNGTLTATSVEGSGTLLRLELPALAASTGTGRDATSPMPVAEEVPRGNGELVLVVDDEVAIRRVNMHTLEAAGYRTLGASNGEEGINVFEQHASEIGLVLTDLMMPVLDGVEMARLLRAQGFAGPILATSGGMLSSGPLAQIENTRFLSKPYTTQQLLMTVHELLAGSSSS